MMLNRFWVVNPKYLDDTLKGRLAKKCFEASNSKRFTNTPFAILEQNHYEALMQYIANLMIHIKDSDTKEKWSEIQNLSRQQILIPSGQVSFEYRLLLKYNDEHHSLNLSKFSIDTDRLNPLFASYYDKNTFKWEGEFDPW